VQLTAGGGTDAVSTAIKAGALDCLQSPIAIEVLKNRIRWFLETKWMRKRLVDFVDYETKRSQMEHMDVEYSVQERLAGMQVGN
jgi:DNA-binding response OmpR family regulator